MPDQPKLVVAHIVRPQGRRGEVLADILTDFPEKFAERKQFWLGSEGDSSPRKYELQEHWFHKGRVVFKFAGVDSISDAEELKGSLVQIPAEARTALGPDSFYVSDLVGSKVTDVGGDHGVIGVIEGVQQSAGMAALLIVRAGKKEYEIPFAQEYVVHFEAEKKSLEMRLPKGMLDVNAPLSEEEKREQRDGKKS